MDDLTLLLPFFFGLVALLYSMAGFGGGSTYLALLALSGLPATEVRVLALICNLLVTVQGSYLLIRRGDANWSLLTPLLLGSIPAAFFGGRWRLEDEVFFLILAVALTLAGLAMLWQRPQREAGDRVPSPLALLLIGGALGFLAGITGIGGGIYLAPVLYLLRFSAAHTIAACTSLFIALNSVAGLGGHLSRGGDIFTVAPSWLLIGCPIAALVGGAIGSRLMTRRLAPQIVKRLAAAVILLVAVRLYFVVF